VLQRRCSRWAAAATANAKHRLPWLQPLLWLGPPKIVLDIFLTDWHIKGFSVGKTSIIVVVPESTRLRFFFENDNGTWQGVAVTCNSFLFLLSSGS
jgi:hypothetical protein